MVSAADLIIIDAKQLARRCERRTRCQPESLVIPLRVFLSEPVRPATVCLKASPVRHNLKTDGL